MKPCKDPVALAAAGATVDEIAALTGLAKTTIYAHLRGDIGRQRKAPEGKWRKCLCCDHTFWSEGAHNRLCNRCRLKSDSPFDSDHAVIA